MAKVSKIVAPRKRLVRLSLFCAVTLVLGVWFLSNASAIHNRNRELDALNKQVEAARAVNADLERIVEYTKTEAWIEQAAREQLGFVRPGEIRFLAE